MTKNILIINPDMSEAKSIKNRLVSSTTNAVCTYTIDDALAAFNMMDFCLVNKVYFPNIQNTCCFT